MGTHGGTHGTDARLVRRVRRGDRDAFAVLWARHDDVARRALAAIGAEAEPQVALLRMATSAALRGRARGADPVRRHVLRIVGRWAAPAAAIDRESPILQAYIALPARARTLLWYLTAERLGPRELAILLGGSPARVERRVAAVRRRLFRRWLAGAHARGLDDACFQVRRHELLGRTRPLGDHLRDHAVTCPQCVIAAGSSGRLLDHLGSLLVAAELGADAAARYRSTAASLEEETDSPAPFDDVRFSGLPGDDLPSAGLTRSAMTVIDSDGFEYSLGPVVVPEDRIRALLAELAEAAEQT